MPEGDHSADHVVMMVANDVRADTRVQKMARTMAGAGYRVTVLGLDHTGAGQVGSIGGAELVVLPVRRSLQGTRPGILGGARSLRRATRRFEIESQIAWSRERYHLVQRDVAARIAWQRQQGLADRKTAALAASGRKARLVDRHGALRSRMRDAVADSAGVRRLTSRVALKVEGLAYKLVRSVQGRRATAAQTAIRRRSARKERLLKLRVSVEHRLMGFRQRRLKRRLLRIEGGANAGPAARRTGTWRRDLPALDDYDVSLAHTLDGMDASAFHAHDVHLLGVAARAAARARLRGVATKLVYDAHEYVAGLARYNQRTVDAYRSVEDEYIGHADAVITVSQPLADLLTRDFRLPERPAVVLNIPEPPQEGRRARSLREAAGLGPGDRIVVYSGGMDEARNVHTVVAALPHLPDDVHLVVVGRSETGYMTQLRGLAGDLGVADRLHRVPFVEPDEVVTYLRGADVAVHPMISSKMNHQIALPNKLFEYLYAGLPMVVSDNEAMMQFVDELRAGVSFPAEDPEECASALVRVLDDPERFTEYRRSRPDLLEQYSWGAQEKVLLALYDSLLSADAAGDGA